MQDKNAMPNWYEIAHQILSNCKELANRVEYWGNKMYLTDTDWATLEGFQIVLDRATEGELYSLRMASGMTDEQFNVLHELYRLKKRAA
ncbi:MAG TPA: hypothetical protein VH186_06485 [Chloroflexia bacterium]|nr:hypothetical protein [Chloroflexia bacterium]